MQRFKRRPETVNAAIVDESSLERLAKEVRGKVVDDTLVFNGEVACIGDWLIDTNEGYFVMGHKEFHDKYERDYGA